MHAASQRRLGHSVTDTDLVPPASRPQTMCLHRLHYCLSPGSAVATLIVDCVDYLSSTKATIGPHWFGWARARRLQAVIDSKDGPAVPPVAGASAGTAGRGGSASTMCWTLQA